MQSLVAQHQPENSQKQQQKEKQHLNKSPQDLSSAITQKAEEILQMQRGPASPLLSSSTDPSLTLTSIATTTCGDVTTASTIPPTQFSEGDIQAAILDNLFVTHLPPPSLPPSTSIASSSSSNLFHTSSDTVNQLLRGLSTGNHHHDSIQRLSQETASVLPNFAKALQSSVSPSPNMRATSESRDNEEEEEEKYLEEEMVVEPGSRPLSPLSGTCIHAEICAV